ncbi:possible cytochrome c oxidase subunit II [Synechococcus sp. BL107]|uniref:cytochrome c oxidase subunit II n=1 Tax=Synechococcus sp. BL107 TaxID=313625 RepID=UPI0000E541A7|nr:cytochrome c oxidase subunit II [Synechococcus sp. BL107]EAU70446.1 possible cytochrome c oxidase subunit II [Synechococcus sp. BL107]
MQIPSAILTLVLGMALVLGGLWIGQTINLLPIDASINAPIYDELFKVLFTIGIILFVGITGLLIFSLIRFRRRSDQIGDGVAIEGNLPLEIFWTAVPAIVVLFVGLYSYDIYDRMGGMVPLAHDHMGGMHEERIWGGISSGSVGSEMVPDVLPIEVTAMQFAFLFHYPDGDITAGELHVPADRPVTLRMESKDVIHAFWVPEFRLKQDIIPGQPTQLSFTATRPGRYPIVCAELCGPYHGGMRSTVVVDEADEWQTWFSNNAKPSPPTDTTVANT